MENLVRFYIGSGPEAHESARKTLQDCGFEGWTEYAARGVWRGETEDSLVIEMGTSASVETLQSLGQGMAQDAGEYSVYLTIRPLTFMGEVTA